jgi:hypothetical protein
MSGIKFSDHVAINGITVEIPANWRVFRKNTQALAGPQGGVIRASDGNPGSVTYGLIADVYRPGKNVNSGTAINGHPLIFSGVISADGSRYAAQRFIWWDVGSRGIHLYADSGQFKEQTACRVAQ